MSIREILSSEGLSSKLSAQNELSSQFNMVLQDMLSNANLPALTGRALLLEFKARGQAEAVVEVPPGLSSLFKILKIVLTVKTSGSGMFGNLSWRYEHPGGGYNGIQIGSVSVGADLESSWTLTSGKSKQFSAPRFPSDPF